MKRVLVIDDDADLRESLRLLLQMEGFEVVEAVNGKQGVDMAFSLLPDLITCDMRMPEYNGNQVVEILSTSPATAQIPVIFISASDENMTEMPPTNYHYVRKPFDVMQLISTIKSYA